MKLTSRRLISIAYLSLLALLLSPGGVITTTVYVKARVWWLLVSLLVAAVNAVGVDVLSTL